MVSGPLTLAEWRRWQRRQLPIAKRVLSRLRRSAPESLALALSGPQPAVLGALDAWTPSQLAAVLEPLRLIAERTTVAIILPSSAVDGLPVDLRRRVVQVPDGDVPSDVLKELQAVLSIGHHLSCGRVADRIAGAQGIPHHIVQHGVLTPMSPPLPSGAHLFAWTDADGAYHRERLSGDVTWTAVGSQLLWNAARQDAVPTGKAGPPLFLGQLHGAELSRSVTVRTVERLAAAGPVIYRPHPAETDLLSRIQHRRWAKRGIQLDTSGVPLIALRGDVIGIFSTGLLEAAAAGRRVWVACVDPPEWVEQLWGRYELARWGADGPTVQPERPAVEPAERIAALALR